MKKVTVLALHLGYGGIEKAISSLVNNICDKYQVEIISTYRMFEIPVFKIDKRVKIRYLMDDKPNKKELIDSLKQLRLITFIKESFKSFKILKLKKNLMINAIKKCDSDIIISTRDIHNYWLGLYGNKKSIKIGWEHNHHNNDEKYINKIVSSVYNLDYFVLVSKSLRDFYEKRLEKSNCECIYIPNLIDEIPDKQSKLDKKNIISVGRLSKEKGYSDLIDVFKLVFEIYPDWKLNIIGDGMEKENLEKKIADYKLKKNIKLLGFKNKEYINETLLKSSIYAMGSFSESFGIVILEAFSYGVPCVAFDSAVGATELISNNWDGYLIENRDKEKMAKKIIELIKNQNRRIIMGNNGKKKAVKYSAETIKKEWIKLLK